MPAVLKYQLALKFYPYNVFARFHLATLFGKLGQLEAGEKGRDSLSRDIFIYFPQVLKDKISIPDQNELFSRNLSRWINLSIKELLKAEPHLKSPDLYYALGLNYELAHQLNKAIDYYNYALAYNPDFEMAKKRIALCYLENGDKRAFDGNFTLAIREFNKGLSYQPENQDLILHQTFARLALGESLDLKGIVMPLLKREPTNPRALLLNLQATRIQHDIKTFATTAKKLLAQEKSPLVLNFIEYEIKALKLSDKKEKELRKNINVELQGE